MFDARLPRPSVIETLVIETPANLSTKSMKRFSFAARFVRAMRGCLALAAVLLIASGRASAATPVTANYVATPTAVNTTAVWPSSMAVDGHGNIFYLDAKGSCPHGVSELAATNGVVNTSTTATCLFSSTLSGGVGIAVDTVGDVYVATGIYVYEIALDSNGKISSSSAVTTVVNADASGDYFLLSVAVDASGNLYMGANLLAGGGSRVVEHKSGGSGLTTLATGFDVPILLALDAGGDVYVLDDATHQVYKIPAGSSSVAVSSLTVLPVPSGVEDNLQSVSTDSNGDVFVAYQPGSAGNGVYEVVASGGVVTASSPAKIVAAGTPYFSGMALSGDGKTLYIGETTGSGSLAAGDGIYTASLQGVNMGSVAVAAGTPTTATISFVIDTAGSIGAPLVLTGGAVNQGFTDLGTGSCTAAHGSYSAGATCTVNVQFNPTAVGLLQGVVELTDTNGKVIAQAWLSGTGLGPILSVDPASSTKYTATNGQFANPANKTFVAPSAVAVDAAGDLFVGDNQQGQNLYQSAALYFIPAGSTTATLETGDFNYISGLAQDAAGNLYLADATVENERVAFFPNGATSGSFTFGTSPQYSTLINTSSPLFGGTALSAPWGLTVGPDGTLYISDLVNGASGHSRVVSYSPTTGQTGVVATGLAIPRGLAVDAAGNLYVADSGYAKVFVYSGGVLQQTLTIPGVEYLVGVSLEPSGSLLVTDSSGAVVRVPNEDGTLIVADALTIETIGSTALGMAVDAAGSLYVANYGGAAINKYTRSQATLNFGTVLDGASATLNETMFSTGNQTLPGISSPGTDYHDFSWDYDDNGVCDSILYGTQGTGCIFSATFDPQSGASGPLTNTTTLSQTGINPLWATITMNGTAAPQQVATPTFSALSGTYATAQTVGLSDATTGATIYYSTTGTATTSSTKYTGTPISVAANETISAVATATGDTTSAVASASYVINTNATATNLGLAVSPAGSNTPNQTETLTATLLGPPSTTATNLVVNGGFETGDDSGWMLAYPDGISTVAHTGSYAAIFANYPVYATVLSQTLTTIAGAQYTVSFWADVEYPDGSSQDEDLKAQWNGATLVDVSSSVAGGWIQYTATVTGTGNDTLSFVGYNVPASTNLDDIFVKANAPIVSAIGESVSFYDGATLLGSGTLNAGGVATLTTSAASDNLLPLGKHSLTAFYAGDANTAASTSPAVPYTVGDLSSTTLTMSSNSTPVSSGASLVQGSQLTLTATVVSGTTPVTVGTVNFCNASASICSDINRIGTAQLNSSGVASITLFPGAGASYSYKAVYVGAPNAVVGGASNPYFGSSSNVMNLYTTVGGNQSTTTALVNNTTGTTPPFSLTATVTTSGSSQSSLTGGLVSFSGVGSTFSAGPVSLAGNTQSFGFVDPNSSDPQAGIGNGQQYIAVGDFDGDGVQDVVVSVNSPTGNSVQFFQGIGGGAFGKLGSIAMDASAGKIVTGDFNNDGQLDFAVVTSTGADVFISTGNFSFSKKVVNLSSIYGSSFTSIAVGDFDGDGTLDLALTTSDSTHHGVVMLHGNGGGGFTPFFSQNINGTFTDIEVGDFNEDGVLDLAVTNATNGAVDILLGNGDGTFKPAVAYSAGSSPQAIAVGRFNGDSHLDLAVPGGAPGANNLFILAGNGDGTFAAGNSVSEFNLGGTPNGIVVGDFNGDGVPDLAVSSSTGVDILAGNLGAKRLPSIDFTTLGSPLTFSSSTPYMIATGDLNGDGLGDLAIATLSTGSIEAVTITPELAQFTQTATATASVTPPGGTTQIQANYAGAGVYQGSTSNTISVTTNTLGSINFGTRPTTPLAAGGTAGVVSVNVYQTNGEQDMTDTGTIQLVVTYPDKTTQTYSSPFSNGTTFFSTALFNLTELGTYSYTASVVGSPSITATATEIVYGPAVSLAVGGYPTTVPAGFASYGEVGVLDASGNVAIGFNGTVTVTTSESSVSIPVTLTSGVGTFNTSFATAATNQSITASYTGLTSTPETGITVAPVRSFVVNTTADDSPTTVVAAAANCPANPTTTGAGNCTLRDALVAAQSNGGNITFDAKVFATAQTIKLTGTGIAPAGSELPSTPSPSTLYLPGYTSVTGPTTGSGANLTNLVTIDGNTTSTIFAAEGNFYSTSTLSNLNLQNGNGGPDPGGAGGLNVYDSILNVNHCVFLNNQGTDAGAIYSDESVLTIVGSSFTGNKSFGGDGDGDGDAGAIYNDGEEFNIGIKEGLQKAIASPLLSSSEGSLATRSAAPFGVTVTNSTFTNNSGEFTGGILNYTLMTVTGSSFTGNTSTGDGDDDADGGAIVNFSHGTVSMEGPPAASPANTPIAGIPYVGSSTFTNNSGLYGGAITNAGYDGPGSSALSVAYSTFKGNTSASDDDGDPDAGAIANVGALLELAYDTFVGNSSSSQLGAGAIYNSYSGDAKAYGITVSGNSGYFGAIDSDNTADSSNILNSIVSGNTTTNTGTTSPSDPNNNGFFYKTTQGNIIGTSAVNLASLGNYGGPTQTMPPLPSSTAICAGAFRMLTTVYNNTGSTLTLDQRGLANTNASYPGYTTAAPCVDAGAVQTHYAISFATQPPSSIGSGVAFTSANAPQVTLTESSNPFAGDTTPLAVAASPVALSAGSLSIATGTASFSGLSITSATTPTEQLTATLGLNASLSTPLSLKATSSSFTVSNISLTTASLNNGTVGVAYTPLTLSISGGTAPYTYSHTGALPAGITLSSAGVLSGTPTAGGTFSNIVVTVTDANHSTASKTFSLTIASPTITLPTGNPPAGSYGAAYPAQSIPQTGLGGTAPYTFSLASGSKLPTGMSVSSSGTLSGTPTQTGTFTFTTIATDSSTGSGPYTGSQQYTLTINQASQSINFTQPASPETFGVAPITLTATGGSSTSPLTFTVTGPATVSGKTLTITGTGTVSVTASQAADTNYTAALPVSYNITINAAAPTLNFVSVGGVTVTGSTVLNPVFGAAPFSVVATSASTGAVSYSVASGPATVNGSTVTLTGAGGVVLNATQAATSNYTAANTTIRFQVAQATPQATVSSNPTAILAQNPVTLTATVGSAAATPTGSVTFMNGTTALGTVALTGGIAQLTTSALLIGSNTITATYSGDTNFVSVQSNSAASITVVDFSIGTGSTSGSGGVQFSTITAVPGAALTYTFTISPDNGATTIPQVITLTLNGLPTGATYSFSPATIAAGSGATTVTLTIQLPSRTAAMQRLANPEGKLASRVAPFSLALLLLPFASRMRKAGKRMSRLLSVLLLLGAGMAAMAGITGCGSSTTVGYFNQTPQSYNLTVTAASGSLSHTSTITLNVE